MLACNKGGLIEFLQVDIVHITVDYNEHLQTGSEL